MTDPLEVFAEVVQRLAIAWRATSSFVAFDTELAGPASGLEAINGIDDARLGQYQPYWAARAELLSKTGAHDDARRAYAIAIAIGLERDPAVRRLLQKRQAALQT